MHRQAKMAHATPVSVSFEASLYRDIKFDEEGGGRFTLQFSATEESEALRVLMLRGRTFLVTLSTREKK